MSDQLDPFRFQEGEEPRHVRDDESGFELFPVYLTADQVRALYEHDVEIAALPTAEDARPTE